uniref:Uncharacterized protein n=1 Tax=Strix occidentalis caurina TaxID=311401 RepID=A0A8D0KWM6_STROC
CVFCKRVSCTFGLFTELVGKCRGSRFDGFITPEGRRITKLDQTLLNGSNVTTLPGHMCV